MSGPLLQGKVCAAFSCHGDGCFKGKKTLARCIVGQDFCEVGAWGWRAGQLVSWVHPYNANTKGLAGPQDNDSLLLPDEENGLELHGGM